MTFFFAWIAIGIASLVLMMFHTNKENTIKVSEIVTAIILGPILIIFIIIFLSTDKEFQEFWNDKEPK